MIKKTIIRLLGLVVLIAFIITTVVFTSKLKKQIRCESVVVTIDETDHFVIQTEILTLISKSKIVLKGTLMDTLNTDRVERIIQEHPWVKQAEVFKGYEKGDSALIAGAIKIHIKQRRPIARVQQLSNGFYLDNEGFKMPFSSTATTMVPVFTGHVSAEKIDTGLLEFAQFVSNNPFWKAQLVQIDVQSNGELLLIPRAGNHDIEFGKPENIENKFRNLKAVYEQGFSRGNWNKYKSVSLKFNNQVVCTRN